MALCATDAAITGSAGHEILMAALRQVVGWDSVILPVTEPATWNENRCETSVLLLKAFTSSLPQ